MEENDLPDFDADDLLAAMAEQLRKDEIARADPVRDGAGVEDCPERPDKIDEAAASDDHVIEYAR